MLYDCWGLPNGVSEFTAKHDDLALVTVDAESSLDARWHDDVRRLLRSGYHLVDVVEHGRLSTVALRVRDRARRELDNSDRPPGYDDANSTRRPGVPHFPR